MRCADHPPARTGYVRPGLVAMLAAGAVFAIGTAAAQTAPASHTVKLIEGRGELLEFQNDIARVVISEPKIADAVVVSPREVMVNAKGPGRTTLVVWENGAAPLRYDVDVSKDMAEWEEFRRQMAEGAAGDAVTVSGTGDTIVLTGSVKSAAISKRLAGMAQARAKNVVNLLVAPPPPPLRQILLEVKFADVDRVALTQIGFNLLSTNPKFVGAGGTEQFTPPRFGQLATGTGAPVASTVSFSDLLNLYAFLPNFGLGATIKALQQRDLLQILAEPNLIVLEGKDASFLAGGQFPYPTITTTPTGGATAPVVTVQFKPFGVKLDFTPTVTPDGLIDLKVAPEVSSLDFSNAVTIEGVTIPALSERRAETEVMLRDGESFAIAGLINDNITETVAKVPGLASLPILGKLFQSRSTQKSTDELLVVITAHFVRPLGPNEKAKLPDMPENFLPAVVEEKTRKKKGAGTSTPPAGSGNQPEFVGPRGQQVPNQ